MSTSCFYGNINDKCVPRVFMKGLMINAFLVFLKVDKWEMSTTSFYGRINDKWVSRVSWDDKW
jgi:hypothetical protein